MNKECEMFPALPVYTVNDRNKELGRPDEPVKAFQNDLCVQINRLMDHFGQEASDIVSGVGIPYSTLSGWINNKVGAQILDSQIKELARYWGISVDYLAFATPMNERDFEIEKQMEEKEEKSA